MTGKKKDSHLKVSAYGAMPHAALVLNAIMYFIELGIKPPKSHHTTPLRSYNTASRVATNVTAAAELILIYAEAVLDFRGCHA